MSELEYCAFCDGGYAHSGICDKCATEIGQTGKELADKEKQLAEARAEIERLKDILYARGQELTELDNKYHAERESDGEVIEQMREALRAWVRTPNITLCEAIKTTEAALEAAERGES